MPPAPSTTNIGGMGPGVCFIMARMKKPAVLVLSLFVGSIARATSTLDIGTDYRLRLLWYNLQANLFTFKTAQNVGSNNGSDIYGLELTKPMQNTRYQVSVVTEHDASGSTVYKRPSENASPNNPQFLAQSPGQTFST